LGGCGVGEGVIVQYSLCVCKALALQASNTTLPSLHKKHQYQEPSYSGARCQSKISN